MSVIFCVDATFINRIDFSSLKICDFEINIT